MQGEQNMVNLENQHLREQAVSNEAQIAQLSYDVESKAGNLERDVKELQVMRLCNLAILLVGTILYASAQRYLPIS